MCGPGHALSSAAPSSCFGAVFGCLRIPETRFHFKTEVLRFGRVGKTVLAPRRIVSCAEAHKERVLITRRIKWGQTKKISGFENTAKRESFALQDLSSVEFPGQPPSVSQPHARHTSISGALAALHALSLPGRPNSSRLLQRFSESILFVLGRLNAVVNWRHVGSLHESNALP